MGSLTGPPDRNANVGEDIGWFRIEDPGTAGMARRAAAEAGQRVGFSEARRGQLSIAAAELASNLHKHADAGAMLVRLLRRAGQDGVLLVAVDAGPGMLDTAGSSRDGYSTAGTLGIGLGAIERLATGCDSYSLPGRGTVLAAQFWPGPDRAAPMELAVDGVVRPMTGQHTAGDGFAVRHTATGPLLLLSDGLGHGPLAAAASAAAIEAFHTAPDESPAAVVEWLHKRMGHTRGAAVGVAAVDRVAWSVRYAGLGNIAGYVATSAERRQMVSMPGIAGHQRRVVREFSYDLPHDAAVILHSDGLTDRWKLADYPGLTNHEPVIVAATLLRDAGLRRDDAGVMVATPARSAP